MLNVLSSVQQLIRDGSPGPRSWKPGQIYAARDYALEAMRLAAVLGGALFVFLVISLAAAHDRLGHGPMNKSSVL